MTQTLHDRLAWSLRQWLLENNLKTDDIEIKVIFPTVRAYMEAYRTWRMVTPTWEQLNWHSDRPSIKAYGMRLTMDIPPVKDKKEIAAL